MDMMPDIPATFRPEQPSKVIRVLSDDGTLDPRHDPRLSESEVLEMYRWMVTTRQLDERLVALQRQGRIGFHVGSLGEEAAIIGAAFAMRKSDWLFRYKRSSTTCSATRTTP
jgi:TPP-dependent pyruvate/acetoin dehydrogenase alpha subunit